jgi:hypothetical protein
LIGRAIAYLDSGGDGPTVVLLHGVLMNHCVARRDHEAGTNLPVHRAHAAARRASTAHAARR